MTIEGNHLLKDWDTKESLRIALNQVLRDSAKNEAGEILHQKVNLFL